MKIFHLMNKQYLSIYQTNSRVFMGDIFNQHIFMSVIDYCLNQLHKNYPYFEWYNQEVAASCFKQMKNERSEFYIITIDDVIRQFGTDYDELQVMNEVGERFLGNNVSKTSYPRIQLIIQLKLMKCLLKKGQRDWLFALTLFCYEIYKVGFYISNYDIGYKQPADFSTALVIQKAEEYLL